MAKVSVRNVSKSYPGDVTAIDLDLEIGDGEFVVLAGPLGSGKSTILRLIAGVEKVARGDIYIGERSVTTVPANDRDVAAVFQSESLYPGMTVYDNMAFGLTLRKFRTLEIKKRVQDAAEILGIEKLLERKPDTLSSAQRQRAAIGRAVVRQPKVFLFDDPLAGLDSNGQTELRTEITQLHQRLEATMIYATRNESEAMLVGDRIVMLRDGRVQQNDTPQTLYNNPVNLFVARSLGRPAINILEGTLKQERDALLFREKDGGTVEARFPNAGRAAAQDFIGKPILLGIRPEDLEVAPLEKGKENAAAVFPAILEIVEPTGGGADLYVGTGAHTLVCRSQQQLNRRETGRRMQVKLDLEKAHFFDPVSSLRIV